MEKEKNIVVTGIFSISHNFFCLYKSRRLGHILFVICKYDQFEGMCNFVVWLPLYQTITTFNNRVQVAF